MQSTLDNIHSLMASYEATQDQHNLTALTIALQKFGVTQLPNTFMTQELDNEVYRVLAVHLKWQLTVKQLSSHVVLSKYTNINLVGSAVGEAPIDQIMLTKFPCLLDKIVLFNHVAKIPHEARDVSLKRALVMAYFADQEFYEYLQNTITEEIEIAYFPQKYSYNPYQNRKDLLQEAVFHLLNLGMRAALREENGVQQMIKMFSEYNDIVQYKSVMYSEQNAITHSIFYLVESGKWDVLQKFVKYDSKVLLMLDNIGNTPLISTILTFTHGNISSGKEHDSLLNLQKFCIDQYIGENMREAFKRFHKFIEPQIALLIGYSQYDKIELNSQNETFIKKNKMYYKILLQHFISKDRSENKNAFFISSIDHTILKEGNKRVSLYNLIFHLGYKIDVNDFGIMSHNTIAVHESQKANVSQNDLFNELYRSLFAVPQKIHANAMNILGELQSNIMCNKINDITVIREDEKEHIFSALCKDFLFIKYAENFVGRDDIMKKLFAMLANLLSQNGFDAGRFCIENRSTFDLLCAMGEHELLKEFKFLNPDVVPMIVPNAITAFWYANEEKSDNISAQSFIKTFTVLDMMLAGLTNERMIDVTEKTNKIGEKISSYLAVSIENANTETNEDLDITFSLDDGKFKLIGHASSQSGYIRLYNFTIAFLAKQFLWSKIPDENLHLKTNFEQEKSKNLFGKIYDKIQKKLTASTDIAVIQSIPNQHNLEKAIHLMLTHLGQNHTNSFDRFQKELQNLFSSLYFLAPQHAIFRDILNNNSNLCLQISLTSAFRSKNLFEHFFNLTTNIVYKEHDLICTISKFVKHAIITHDIDGQMLWLNYGIELMKNQGCSNDTKQNLIRYAIEAAVGLASHDSLKGILRDFPSFLLQYNNKIFKHYECLFSILRAHSKSKMMESKQFRDVISSLAVTLLEFGYPIELVKASDEMKTHHLIESLLKSQIKYSVTMLGLDWTSKNLQQMFLMQSGIIEFGAQTLQTTFLLQHYISIYKQSFNFLYKKLSNDKKIDISGFVYQFPAILQRTDLLAEIKKITFFTGFKETDDHSRIISNAGRVFKIVQETHTLDHEMEFINLYNKYAYAKCESIKDVNELLPQDHLEYNLKKVVMHYNAAFLPFRYQMLHRKNHLKVQDEDFNHFKEMISKVGAAAITGTFMYLNNEYNFREKVHTVLSVMPTIYSGITIATNALKSFAENIINVVDVVSSTSSYSGIYLALTGATIYLGYKMMSDNDRVVEFDLKLIRTLIDKHQKDFRQKDYKLYHTEYFIYFKIKNLFDECVGKEFVTEMRFFSLIERFNMTSSMISDALYNLETIEEDVTPETVFTIAYTLSIIAMYLNTKKIDDVMPHMTSDDRIKTISLLHDVMAGQVTNIQKAAHDMQIPESYLENFMQLSGKGYVILMDHYDISQHDKYMYALKNFHRVSINTEGHEKINCNPFYKFIYLLSSRFNHCAISNHNIKQDDNCLALI